MRIHFIGAGKLGKTIAKLIHTHHTGEIIGIVNSTLDSAKHACEFIGAGTAYSALNALPESEIIFITTPDEIIEKTCQDLIDAHALTRHSVIVHCSGVLPSSILAAAKTAECSIASVHPIKSFADPETLSENFAGTYCSLEGDASALDILKTLFENLGAITFQINSQDKVRYHAALVLANNYATTLHYHATQLLQDIGLEKDISKSFVTSLQNDALTNIQASNHQQALTGPIQRGDLQTIQKHLEALPDGYIKQLYAVLGLGTLELTTLSPTQVSRFQTCFAKASGVES